MMSANRFAWNLLAEKTACKLFTMNKTDISKKFRPLIKKKNIKTNMSISSTPEECFDSAYRDILKAKKTITAASIAKKKETGKGFAFPEKLKFKTKKHGGNSIEIRARSIQYFAKSKTIKFFPKYFGKGSEIKIKTNLKKLNIKFDYSCRLTTHNNRYFLLIPYVRDVPEVSGDRKCAIDPGCRTFLTGYDPEGMVFEMGKDNYYITRKQKQIKKLQSKLSSETNKHKKLSYRRIINNTYNKISNCINDLHHKTTKILADTYKQILLPTFGTSKMVKKDNRKINGTTANNLMTFCHFKFRTLLKHKMELRNGNMISCTEEYTSKTCGDCGRLNHKLFGNKEFICPFDDCKLISDRDFNASRNIFMKNYSLFT